LLLKFLNCSVDKTELGKFLLVNSLFNNTGSCRPNSKDFSDDDPRIVNYVELDFLGTYQNKRFWDDLNKIGTALISTYAPESKWVFTVNGLDGSLDIIDISNPRNPYFVKTINFRKLGFGNRPTYVIYKNGVIAATAEQKIRQLQGKLILFDSWGNYLAETYVGSQPDFATFTQDGCKILVANEGEPNDDYTWDPEGSVSVIDLSNGLIFLESKTIHVDFKQFNNSNIDKKIRITGPNASVSQDFEPESITVTPDNRFAYVSLQENNTVAVLDLKSYKWIALLPLGFKNWSFGAPYSGNGIDFRRNNGPPSPPNGWGTNNPGNENYLPSFIKGQYQPDEIRIFEYNGGIYFISANEGDSRNYQSRQGDEDGDPTYEFFNEEVSVVDFCTPSKLEPYSSQIILSSICTQISTFNFGSASDALRLSKVGGDTNGDGIIDEIYTFGARSISIWTGDGNLVWDSDLEEMLSGNKYLGKAYYIDRITNPKNLVTSTYPFYNTSFDRAQIGKDRRSNRQGPEPEGVALGKIGNKLFAFIGLERPGGVAVYDITNPNNPIFQYYLNFRSDSNVTTIQETLLMTNLGRAGDLGPEGISFIPASQSPNGKDLILISNETSGSITLFEVKVY